MRFLRLLSIALGATALLLSACGDDSDGGAASATPTTAVSTEESAVDSPAATEASPESPPAGPAETGELSESDRALVTDAVNAYIAGLNAHDGGAVCALFEPGAIPPRELPRRGGDCPGALGASIGVPPKGGGPAWRKTTIQELNEVAVGPDRARVTATVTHRFSDRNYISLEEDVIYLDRSGERWLVAKPSGTLYRAVGYPEPPLRALTPPAG